MPALLATLLGRRRVQQPLHALQQAAQHLTVGGLHVQRQRDDVIDYYMRGQIALADAGAFGLVQDFAYFLDGEELCNDAEADVVGDPAASRQLRQCARHWALLNNRT